MDTTVLNSQEWGLAIPSCPPDTWHVAPRLALLKITRPHDHDCRMNPWWKGPDSLTAGGVRGLRLTILARPPLLLLTERTPPHQEKTGSWLADTLEQQLYCCEQLARSKATTVSLGLLPGREGAAPGAVPGTPRAVPAECWGGVLGTTMFWRARGREKEACLLGSHCASVRSRSQPTPG